MEKDAEMCELRLVIQQGWPTDVPEIIRGYWNHRDQLVIEDGVVFLGNRLVIPKILRPNVLSQIHEGHLGIEMSKKRAREVVFWPGMNAQIEQKIRLCNTCQKFQKRQSAEPYIYHKRPETAFLKIGADFFEFDGKEYLLIVDYTSEFIEIKQVSTQSSSEAIKFCKETFARYGIPLEFVSDNATAFTSYEFKEFAKQYDFKLTTSSPEYPKSNGMAERSVQCIKNLLKKSKDSNQDFYLALLTFRNNPKANSPSPAQILMNRKLRDILPMKSKNLK